MEIKSHHFSILKVSLPILILIIIIMAIVALWNPLKYRMMTADIASNNMERKKHALDKIQNDFDSYEGFLRKWLTSKDENVIIPLLSVLKNAPEEECEKYATEIISILDGENARLNNATSAFVLDSKWCFIYPDTDGGADWGGLNAIEDKVLCRYEISNKALREICRYLIRFSIEDTIHQFAAIDTLADLEIDISSELLLALASDDSDISERAAYLLGERRIKDSYGALLKYWQKEYFDISSEAKNAINKLGPKFILDTVDHISTISTGPEYEMGLRGSAICALGEYQYTKAVEALTKVIRESNNELRYYGIDSLAKIRSHEAIDALIDGLSVIEKEDRDNWEYVIELLAEINTTYSMEKLVGLIKDKRAHIREAAINNLTKISNKNFGEDYNSWLEWFKNKYKE